MTNKNSVKGYKGFEKVKEFDDKIHKETKGNYHDCLLSLTNYMSKFIDILPVLNEEVMKPSIL